MTCGITVAPRMPTASSTLSVPSKPGTKPPAMPDGDGSARKTWKRERADDHANEAGDHGLEPAKAARLQREDAERGGAGQQRGRKERRCRRAG